MNVDFPFAFNDLGRTRACSDDEHIRDMIEQVLLTSPGERVNRPTFGCGLLQLVFAPNGDVLTAATQFTVQASLQQWLGDVIDVLFVDVGHVDSQLNVTVLYLNKMTGEELTAKVAAGGGP